MPIPIVKPVEIALASTAKAVSGQEAEYAKPRSGTGLNLILLPAITNPADLFKSQQTILGKLVNFSFQESYQVEPLNTVNRDYAEEFILGPANAGNFSAGAAFSSKNTNNLTTMLSRKELIGIEVLGDSDPNAGEIVNIFFGIHVTSKGHGANGSGGAVMYNISGTYGLSLTGAEYALKYNAPSSLFKIP